MFYFQEEQLLILNSLDALAVRRAHFDSIIQEGSIFFDAVKSLINLSSETRISRRVCNERSLIYKSRAHMSGEEFFTFCRESLGRTQQTGSVDIGAIPEDLTCSFNFVQSSRTRFIPKYMQTTDIVVDTLSDFSVDETTEDIPEPSATGGSDPVTVISSSMNDVNIKEADLSSYLSEILATHQRIQNDGVEVINSVGVISTFDKKEVVLTAQDNIDIAKSVKLVKADKHVIPVEGTGASGAGDYFLNLKGHVDVFFVLEK